MQQTQKIQGTLKVALLSQSHSQAYIFFTFKRLLGKNVNNWSFNQSLYYNLINRNIARRDVLYSKQKQSLWNSTYTDTMNQGTMNQGKVPQRQNISP